MKSIYPQSRKHDISFYPSGRIDISAHIARLLHLTDGDVIDFVLDKSELYLYVKLRAGEYVGRHTGRVWATAHGKGTFRACSKQITRAILNLANKNSRLRCACGAQIFFDNISYITIIYRYSL